VDRQPGHDGRHRQDGVSVTCTDGRGASSAEDIAGPRHDPRTTGHPLCYILFADRLSRHRREWDWYPSVRGVPDSRWCGAAEQNWVVSWRHIEFLRPPLEMLPLARTKAEIDGFFWSHAGTALARADCKKTLV
jgi:hypothetical protein